MCVWIESDKILLLWNLIFYYKVDCWIALKWPNVNCTRIYAEFPETAVSSRPRPACVGVNTPEGMPDRGLYHFLQLPRGGGPINGRDPGLAPNGPLSIAVPAYAFLFPRFYLSLYLYFITISPTTRSKHLPSSYRDSSGFWWIRFSS